MADLQKLFINIYGEYSKTSEMYMDATELENYFINLIGEKKTNLNENVVVEKIPTK